MMQLYHIHTAVIVIATSNESECDGCCFEMILFFLLRAFRFDRCTFFPLAVEQFNLLGWVFGLREMYFVFEVILASFFFQFSWKKFVFYRLV